MAIDRMSASADRMALDVFRWSRSHLGDSEREITFVDPERLAEAADPEALGRFLAELPDAPHTHRPREDEYKGHRIVVETHYEITVDGRHVPVHVSVGNDGDVHCHALPAYEFVSAVDMVRVLIDTYPEDFPAVAGPGSGGAGHQHGDAGRGVEEG